LVNGRLAEARAQLKRATELDPLSPITFGSYGVSLAASHLNDAAIVAGKRAVELDSSLVVTRFMLGAVYLEAGRLNEATTQLEAAQRIDASSVTVTGLLGYAYAKSGNSRRAVDLAAGVEAQTGRTRGAGLAAALIHLALGDKAPALSLLERAAADHDALFASESLAESFFDPIRGDPRFAAIVAKVGLDKRVLTPR
jgi:predicted Zn-dependent protease